MEREELEEERGRKARIIIIGSELLKGIVRDINLFFIGRELVKLGFYVDKAVFLNDEMNDIVTELVDAVKEVDLVIVTGGLGPTQDDLTRYAVSRAFGRPLRLSKKVFEKLSKLYRDRNEREKRIRICYIPENAEVLDNRVGVAPGFYLKVKSTHVFILPGVPMEVQEMFVNQVLPILKKLYSLDREKIDFTAIKFSKIREKNLEDIIMDVLEKKNLRLYYKIVIEEHFLVLNIYFPKDIATYVRELVYLIIKEVKTRYPQAEYEFMIGAGGGI